MTICWPRIKKSEETNRQFSTQEDARAEAKRLSEEAGLRYFARFLRFYLYTPDGSSEPRSCYAVMEIHPAHPTTYRKIKDFAKKMVRHAKFWIWVSGVQLKKWPMDTTDADHLPQKPDVRVLVHALVWDFAGRLYRLGLWYGILES